nr:DsrE family protein [Bacteroidota bacterium]
MKQAILTGLIIIIMTVSVKSQSNNDFIDFSGKKITAFVLNEVVQQLKELGNGDTIQIKVDNYEAIDNDLSAWSRITGNQIEIIESETNYKIYRIDKRERITSNKKFALIISDKGLEELLSPLGFAWAAAVSGMEVHIYIQGPAVKIMKNGYKEKLKGFSSIFSSFARKGLSQIGHIPPQEKIKELKKLGAKFYLCQPSMDHFKVKKSDLIFTDLVIAEYVTFLEVLEDSDIKFFVQ